MNKEAHKYCFLLFESKMFSIVVYTSLVVYLLQNGVQVKLN